MPLPIIWRGVSITRHKKGALDCVLAGSFLRSKDWYTVHSIGYWTPKWNWRYLFHIRRVQR